jgi:hypothetical protein
MEGSGLSALPSQLRPERWGKRLMRRVSQRLSDSSASSLGLALYVHFREPSRWQERL